ncbi:MAG: FAD-dependent oxidoreductase, partial [Caldilineaceae bacterium]
TFINSPSLLRPTLQFQGRDDLFFAGQISGTEGYVGSTLGGLMAGINMARLLRGEAPVAPPPTTMIGALLHNITHADPTNFQPMKANMGLLPEIPERIRRKESRYAAYAERARADMEAYVDSVGLLPLFVGEPLPAAAVQAEPVAA